MRNSMAFPMALALTGCPPAGVDDDVGVYNKDPPEAETLHVSIDEDGDYSVKFVAFSLHVGD